MTISPGSFVLAVLLESARGGSAEGEERVVRAVLVGARVAVAVMVGPGRAHAAADDVATALAGRALDGAGNNVTHPDWGRAGRLYSRVVPAAYADGVGTPVAG